MMKKTLKVQLTELKHGGTPFEELVLERWDRGMSVRQIAVDLGWHWTNLYDQIELLGIALPDRQKDHATAVATAI